MISGVSNSSVLTISGKYSLIPIALIAFQEDKNLIHMVKSTGNNQIIIEINNISYSITSVIDANIDIKKSLISLPCFN